VRWARLEDLNYLSETEDARPMDYQIDQRKVHPDYQKPSLYNDIALFHLNRDVEFSSHVPPICLNADPNCQSGTSKTVIRLSCFVLLTPLFVLNPFQNYQTLRVGG